MQGFGFGCRGGIWELRVWVDKVLGFRLRI